MKRVKWVIALAALAIGGTAAFILSNRGLGGSFVEHSPPSAEAHRFYDMGVVDANGDGLLDIYTSNHHFRQALWISDDHGGYRDVLSEWGLDQSVEFPRAELSFAKPRIQEPGLYIFWIGAQFAIHAHKLDNPAAWKGTMRVNDPVKILKNEGFAVQQKDQQSVADETVIEFVPPSEGHLRMRPGGQGLPISLDLADSVPLSRVYVGLGKVSPAAREFSLAMKDRHGMAWADYNDDGRLDVFATRGALSGTLKAHSDEIKRQINDEFLVSQADGRFQDLYYDLGFDKKDCSGRHVRWADVDNDGRLDVFVNCHDREHVKGDYPKQLYLQDGNGRFRDVAVEAGLALPDRQLGSLTWFDADGDRDADLFTMQNEGFFLYRNSSGRFTQETVLLRGSSAGPRIGQTSESGWLYDGKLTVADFDGDGDLDVFAGSKRGNALFSNENGTLVFLEPASIGLPSESIAANWVDYDNDGRVDLHLVPQGLFRQTADVVFEQGGQLAFYSEEYDAAVCNWADFNNDGTRDLLMAAHENPNFDPWWPLSRESLPSTSWRVKSYRNTHARHHWLQLRLVGAEKNREAIGARVTVATADGRQTQEVGSSDGAFFSQGHYRLYFGLGGHSQADVIEIGWPDGHTQVLREVDADQLLTVRRDET